MTSSCAEHKRRPMRRFRDGVAGRARAAVAGRRTASRSSDTLGPFGVWYAVLPMSARGAGATTLASAEASPGWGPVQAGW